MLAMLDDAGFTGDPDANIFQCEVPTQFDLVMLFVVIQ